MSQLSPWLSRTSIRIWLGLAAVIVSPALLAQNWVNVSGCAAVTHRSNGNGQASSCPGEPGMTIASNFVGTTFATVPSGTKTGDIRLDWTALTGSVNPPAISAIYESINGGVAALAPISVGPPSDYQTGTNGNGFEYCFYSSTNYNLNSAQTLVFELTDPISGDIFGYCAYDFSSSIPTLTALPAGLPLDAGTIAGSQSVCSGGDPVAFTSPFSASGGSGTLSFQWQSSTDGTTWSPIAGATSSLFDVPAGLTVETYYRRVVTDGTDTKISNELTVSMATNASFSVTASLAHVSCFGASDGVIEMSIQNSSAPMSYLWNTGATTEDLTGLSGGTYTVTITDGLGCSSTETFTINEPNALGSSAIINQVTCNGFSDGAIDLTITGGTAPYTVQWDNGTYSTEDITGLTAATYQVDITDANGCTYSTSYIVTQPTVFSAAANISNPILCFGGTASATVVGTGGNPPYSYLWSTGATTKSISGLSAGVHWVRVQGTSTCVIFDTITVSAPSALVIASTVMDESCFGFADGAIDVTISGGTSPYTFVWSDGSTQFATSEDVSNLSTGSYSITVTDGNGCLASQNFTVSGPSAALSASLTTIDVNCFSGMTGSIDVSVTGGTSPYTYLWSTGQTTQDLNGLAAGNYTVVITDANGCTSNLTSTITEPAAALIASAIVSDVLCFGNATGAIEVSTSGGTAPYNYVWSSGQTVEDLNNVPAGFYVLTIIDALGCTTTWSDTIRQPTAGMSISFLSANIACSGASTGAIDASVSGGTAPFSYSWNNGASTEDLIGLSAGWYVLTVADASGCTRKDSVQIMQNAALNVSMIQTNVDCFGANTGSLAAVVSGGLAPYTYAWSSGGSTPIKSNLVAGSYSLTVTDAAGCSQVLTTTMAQPAQIVASSSSQAATCFGSVDGSIDLTVSGGAGGFTYVWSNGATTQDLDSVAAGIYTVTIRDSNGCDITVVDTIQQPFAMMDSVMANQVLCFGDSIGSLDVFMSGGTSPYSYQWTTGDSTSNLMGLKAGNYSLTVSDAQGCVFTNTYSITQPIAGLSAVITVTQPLCSGDSTGTLNAQISGGVGPYSLLWSTGDSLNDLDSLAAGVYTLTIADANGCSLVIQDSIVAPTPLAINATVSNISCYGLVNGKVLTAVSGGTAPYTYLWNGGTFTSQNILNRPAGIYSLLVTDANGCSVSDTFAITQPTPFNITASQSQVLCHGDSTGAIALTVTGATAPYSYFWSTGDTAASVANLPAGNYSVSVGDAAGCFTSLNYSITQPAAALAVLDSAYSIMCFGDSTGFVSALPSGGTAPYVVVWNTGDTASSLTNLLAGTYVYTAMDNNGCTVTDTLVLMEPSAITLSVSATDILCYGDSTGSLYAQVSGGMSPYTYTWNNGATVDSVINVIAGWHHLTVTDSNGCSIMDSIQIFQGAALIDSGSIAHNVCAGDSLGSIQTRLFGAIAPYTYTWVGSGDTLSASTGDTLNLSNLTAGTYFLQVVDSAGCSTQLSYSISEPAAMSIMLTALGTTNCLTDSIGVAMATVSGGAGGYSYLWSSGSTNDTASGLWSGGFWVVVTDSNGCSAMSDTVIIGTYDADCDGIPDTVETTNDADGDGIPNYLDLDSDGDGIPDSVEGVVDTDGDGISNYLDLDSDSDGIPDSIETAADADSDGLGNYIDLDSDGDGIPDAVEGSSDVDNDGLPNFLDLDSDGDGIPDAVETVQDFDNDGIPNYLDLDSDGDGILDLIETSADFDGDTQPNYLDLDSDNDGIPDAVEGTSDVDGDGFPNFLDLDSDGDGIPDIIEGTGDPDGDGIPNYLDFDSDGDGIPDNTEGYSDFDGDGVANFLDLDSDGDGIPDSVETAADADGDGFPNFLDLDSDGDGIPDSVETVADFDGDGLPNYLDADSDNDGISDASEGTLNDDGDTQSNYLDLDSDNDGILDSIELDGDYDNDGTPDYLDLDSDNDLLSDVYEGGGTDPDQDRIIGIGAITDVDLNGLHDAIDPAQGGIALPVPDSDGDGQEDFRDLDSDGDGILDIDEGDVDTDGDGIPDYLDLDSDGDGISDADEYDWDNDGIVGDDCDGDGIPNYLDPDVCNTEIPQAISPNNDGLNDYLIIPGILRHPESHLQIFNRWGHQVYDSGGPYSNDWDGRPNTGGSYMLDSDGILPNGVYYYILTLSSAEPAQTGYIYLKR